MEKQALANGPESLREAAAGKGPMSSAFVRQLLIWARGFASLPVDCGNDGLSPRKGRMVLNWRAAMGRFVLRFMGIGISTSIFGEGCRVD